MAQDLYYVVFDTPAGSVGILGSKAGLRRVTLPRRSAAEAQQLLGDGMNRTALSPHRFQDLMARLGAYFAGHKVDFPDELDLAGATPFQRKVWETARLIPYGETRSYAWVAELIGKPRAGRAVGQALGKNPLPVIVPCHRVIESDGGLRGYGGGLQRKRVLLDHESQHDLFVKNSA